MANVGQPLLGQRVRASRWVGVRRSDASRRTHPVLLPLRRRLRLPIATVRRQIRFVQAAILRRNTSRVHYINIVSRVVFTTTTPPPLSSNT